MTCNKNPFQKLFRNESYLIGNVGFLLRLLRSSKVRYSHLNTRFQSNPPLRSAEAPM